MIHVYHAIFPTFHANKTTITTRDLSTTYHHVADVDTNDLDRAYMLTNSIDKAWKDNDGVEFLGSPDYGKDGCRSTSVGDLLVRYNDNGSFSAYQVASMGFKELTHI